MAISKRRRNEGFVYVARILLPGRKEVSKTFKRKIDAEKWERDQKSKLDSGQDLKSDVSLDWFFNYWLETYAESRKRPTSIRSDKGLYKHHVSPEFGLIKLSKIKAAAIESWLARLTRKCKPKTCNNAFGLLKKLLNDAVRWDYLVLNPAPKVSPLTIPEQEMSYWTVDEVKVFLSYVKASYPNKYLCFALSLYAGMRLGEVRGLRWDCVDLDRRQILIKRKYCAVEKAVVDGTKSKKSRIVPINSVLADLLVAQGQGLRDDLVLAETDFKWAHPHREMDQLCKSAGVPRIRFHDLRHTFASQLVMAGRSIYEVQKLLGHVDIKTTQRYAHLSPEHLKGITDVLDFEAGTVCNAKVIPVNFGK